MWLRGRPRGLPVPAGALGGQAGPCVSILEPAGLQIPETHHQYDPARPHHQVPAAPAQEEEAAQHQRPVPGRWPKGAGGGAELSLTLTWLGQNKPNTGSLLLSRGLLTSSQLGIWGWVILRGGGRPMSCGTLSSIASLHPPDTSSAVQSRQPRSLQILPNSPGVTESPLVENHQVKRVMYQHVS